MPFDELDYEYAASVATDGSAASIATQQFHAVMGAAQVFLATAIADNHSQMRAISDMAGQTEAGADPKMLVQQLVNELAKAASRATRLEAGFAEQTRELEAIQESLTKSEERAKTDTLTGLPNRRRLEEFFRAAQIAAMEQGEPLSVLLLDIDRFKKFNDSFGHGVGDQVLRHLIERCDRALYLAKSSGRNRVVLESELDRELAAS